MPLSALVVGIMRANGNPVHARVQLGPPLNSQEAAGGAIIQRAGGTAPPLPAAAGTAAAATGSGGAGSGGSNDVAAGGRDQHPQHAHHLQQHPHQQAAGDAFAVVGGGVLRPWNWVLQGEDVTWGAVLGDGAFGEVFAGMYRGVKVRQGGVRRNGKVMYGRHDAGLPYTVCWLLCVGTGSEPRARASWLLAIALLTVVSHTVTHPRRRHELVRGPCVLNATDRRSNLSASNLVTFSSILPSGRNSTS